MRILGIIAEYNPFHNGHLYHLEKSKKLTNSSHTIAIMSGNFVQRGEAAIQNKWIRANMAIASGIDLVIELPTVFALSSAELFAYGGVALLDNLKVVNYLSFGCENNDIKMLKNISNFSIKSINNDNELFKKYIKSGLSFPKAREFTLSDIYNLSDYEKNALNSPNNILAIEYLKALTLLDSKIIPLPIKRFGSDYHCENINSEISSATAIRKWVLENNEVEQIKNLIPQKTYDSLKKYPLIHFNQFYDLIKYKILLESKTELQKINQISEGLENKILEEIINSNSLEDLILRLKSKRYTRTRINRILSQILLNIKKDNVSTASRKYKPSYGRILAFNKKGTEIIKHIKLNSDFPLITNLSKFKSDNPLVHEMLSFDIFSTNIYSFFDNSIKTGEDYYRSPHIKL